MISATIKSKKCVACAPKIENHTSYFGWAKHSWVNLGTVLVITVIAWYKVTWEGSVWRQGNFRRGFSYQTATPAPLWHGHAPWNQDAEERTKRYLGRAGRSEQRQAELKGGWSSLCYFINSWGSLLVLPQRAVENPCCGCILEVTFGGTSIGLASSIQIKLGCFVLFVEKKLFGISLPTHHYCQNGWVTRRMVKKYGFGAVSRRVLIRHARFVFRSKTIRWW